MKKTVVFAVLTLFTTVFFIGCSKPVLPIELKESHKRIAIAPFATEEDPFSRNQCPSQRVSAFQDRIDCLWVNSWQPT